jgi:hypothetical protein
MIKHRQRFQTKISKAFEKILMKPDKHLEILAERIGNVEQEAE